MSSGILIYNNKGFEMFYGSDSMATAYAETLNDCASQLSGTKVYSMVIPNHSEFGVPERVRNYYEEASSVRTPWRSTIRFPQASPRWIFTMR